MRIPDVNASADRAARCAIAIMAKAPGAGRTKTRLSPLLSPDEATTLGCCFLRDMTANIALAGESVAVDAYVAFAPAGTEASFDGIVEPGTQFVLADGSMPAPEGVIALGRSLLQAMSSLLARGYGGVALLNADSPNLPTARLIAAARLVMSPAERIVLGPSTDGGYYLIGAKAAYPDLFRSIDWSTKHVAEQTRARVSTLGLPIAELKPWYDVDDAVSLRMLLRDLRAGSGTSDDPYAAPATRRFLADHRIADRLAIRFAEAGS
jgi:rSAM/selenodomain-associated transferase 1